MSEWGKKKAVMGKQVASRAKTKSACSLALGGYQDPENRNQRRKLRSIIEPKHGCLAYVKETLSVPERAECSVSTCGCSHIKLR